jgi:hypothetical protein
MPPESVFYRVFMHFLALLGVFFAAVTLLAYGVLSVWRDLNGHMTQGAPLLVENDGLTWPSRYRGAVPVNSTKTPDVRLASRR